MSLILMTTLFHKAVILQGEIWRWSLLWLKGLKSFYCVYVFTQNWRTVAWRQRELMNTETGSRNRGKNGSFCLKHVQGLKDSAAHPYPNFPQVRPLPSTPPPQDKDKNMHFYFKQYPGASFASPEILDFRLIVTSYISRCVSSHPFSQ